MHGAHGTASAALDGLSSGRGGWGRSDAREVERAGAHPLVCWERRICVHKFRWCAAERSYDILHAILRGPAHYQTPVPHDMNDGVTMYRLGERDLRVLHGDVGERSQKGRRTHRGIGERAHSDGERVGIWHRHDLVRGRVARVAASPSCAGRLLFAAHTVMLESVARSGIPRAGPQKSRARARMPSRTPIPVKATFAGGYTLTGHVSIYLRSIFMIRTKLTPPLKTSEKRVEYST